MENDNLNLIQAPKQSPGWGSSAAEGPEKMSRWAVLTKAGMIMVIKKTVFNHSSPGKCMGQRVHYIFPHRSTFLYCND